MTVELAKAAPDRARLADVSIQTQPPVVGAPSFLSSWVLSIASVADTLPPWGQIKARDRALREFWPTEPYLAGALYTVCQRNANQNIILNGPPRTVAAVQDMLDNCQFGKGIEKVFLKTSLDLYTQSNGAFIELAGRESEGDPVVSLNHLDAAQCVRTGNAETPVIWTDPLTGARHELAWYQVITLEEMPSPIFRMYDAQYSALDRILRAAQIIRDVAVLRGEQTSGRFTRRVNLVSGVQTSVIEDKLRENEEKASNKGFRHLMEHVIIGSLDPTANVSVANIDLAWVPENFDEELALKWYINAFALNFGEDYQTFAPLPGHSLGTSQQSQTLHQKSIGKGPKTWTKMVAKAFRAYRVVPASVEFAFEEKDAEGQLQEADIRDKRAGTRAARIASGEITVSVARQIAEDEGDLDRVYLDQLEGADITEDVTVTDEEDASAVLADVNRAARLPPAASPTAPAPTVPPPLPPPAAKDLLARFKAYAQQFEEALGA